MDKKVMVLSRDMCLQVLASLSVLLRSQEAAVWSSPSTQQVYKGLLTFTTHKKPKVSGHGGQS